MSSYTYYVNGDFVPAEEAGVSFNDLGIVRGYGVFDFLRTYGRTPFRLREHLERLEQSAHAIDLPLPWTIAELERITHETLARNPEASDVSIRLVVTGGHSPSFLMPTGTPSLYVLIAPIPPANPALFEAGASLITVDYERFLPSVKSLNYITAIMALKQARQAGAVEALYRTRDRKLTECTTSNFFVFKEGRLVTSDVGVLAGITRLVTLEIAGDLYEIDYRPIAYDELGAVDEAFITSTTKEIMPIVRINDVQIGDGRVGPHAQRLMAIFHEVAQRESAQQEWAEPVRP